MENCDICGKKSNFNGLVWYAMDLMPETHLCRSHYLKWCHHHKPYVNKHKNVKPTTKAWKKMCDEEAVLFQEWLKEQKKIKGFKQKNGQGKVKT